MVQKSSYKFKNLKIEHKGDLRHMFKDSILLINSDCTSGLEAELYGLPTINYRPQRIVDYDTTSGLNSLGNLSSNPEEVIQLVDDHIKGIKKLKMGQGLSKLKKYIFNINDLGFATNNIAKDIVTFISLNDFKTKNSKFNFFVSFLKFKNHIRNTYNKYKFKNIITK